MLQAAIAGGAVGGYYTSQFSGEEIDKKLRGGLIYDYAVSGGYTGTEAEFLALMGSGPWVPEAGYVPASNPNLLDNWYFMDPINQRGKTEYTQLINHKYGPDRWFSSTEWGSIEANIKLLSSGFQITSVPNTAYPHAHGILEQQIDDVDQYIGKLMTVSALVTSVEASDTGTYPYLCAVQRTGFSYHDVNPISAPGLISLTFTVNENIGGIGIRVTCGTTKSSVLTVAAIKLELGNRQTLAHHDSTGNWVLNGPPPDKGLELLKCQRYYQVFATESLRPTKAQDFRPTMRIDPALSTIEIDGVTYYTADANL